MYTSLEHYIDGNWVKPSGSKKQDVINPSNSKPIGELGHVSKGDLDKALGQLEAGLNLPSPWVPVPDWSSATTALRQALAASPGRAEAHNVLGLLLGRQGASSSEVTAAFREAIRLRPGFAEARNNLGLVLIQSGDDPGGIAAFREAVRLEKDYADAHANLGAALVPTDAEEAVRELEKAVALAPTLAKARFNLASAYAASPSHGRAKEIAERDFDLAIRKVLDGLSARFGSFAAADRAASFIAVLCLSLPGGEDRFYDSHTQLDFSVAQRITRNVRVFFDALNLTDAPLRYFEGVVDRPLQEEHYRSWFDFGVKVDWP
jgi:tetratricopeptide (TPR) repeat protein